MRVGVGWGESGLKNGSGGWGGGLELNLLE